MSEQRNRYRGRRIARVVVAVAGLCLGVVGASSAETAGTVVEYPVAYPNATHPEPGACHPAQPGSTHEITFDPRGGDALWITGQNYSYVVRVSTTGEMTYFPMPEGSGPHGIEFDADGRLWVTLEFHGEIVRLDDEGKIVQTIDVGLDCPTCPEAKKFNPRPHGMGFGLDGRTIWFTGKATGTVGRIDPDGRITTYVLPTVGSVPIYVRAGNDGSMWVTELVGNKIARITPDGEVTEMAIPSHDSRPIAIVPEPGSDAMWFSEESGNRVARVAADGTITEFPVPTAQANMILAGLAFDRDGNLWVQQYVNQNAPTPTAPSPPGDDYVLRIDRSILTAPPGDLSQVPVTYFKVPTRQTVMHRILQGPDGDIWFTELASNRVGKVALAEAGTGAGAAGEAAAGQAAAAPATAEVARYGASTTGPQYSGGDPGDPPGS